MRQIYLAVFLSLMLLLPKTSPLLASPFEVLTPDNIDRITELRTWKIDGYIGDVAWSPLGDLAAIAVDNTIQLYDPQDWEKPVRILNGHVDWIWDMAFSADGKHLVSGSGGIGPDGKSRDNSAKVWDVTTGDLLLTLPHPEHEQVVDTVAFSPDGSQVMTVTFRFDHIRFWDAQTGELLSELPIEPIDGGWPEILSSAFSPDRSLYAMGSLHNDLKIWRLGNPLTEIPDLPNYGAELVFSSDSQKFAAANRYGAYAVIHDVTTGDEIATDYVMNMQFSALAFSPDGQILAQAGFWQENSNITLRFWNPENGKPLFIIDNPRTYIDYLVFKPDGTLMLSANTDGEIGLWGIPTKSFS